MYFSFLPVGCGQEYVHHPVGYGQVQVFLPTAEGWCINPNPNYTYKWNIAQITLNRMCVVPQFKL